MTLTREQSNALKLLAITLMIVDHMGAVFFPEQPIWRMVGRLAFPLFAYQLAVGFEHTRNRKKQFLYLTIFAVLSQIPYMFALGITPAHFSLNIFFTFFFSYGLMWLWTMCKTAKGWMLFVISCLFLLSDFVPPVDYGLYGIILPFGFYLLRKHAYLQIGLLFMLTGWKATIGSPLQVFAIFSTVAVAIISILPIPVIRVSKWFFYWFYPVHLGILAVIASMMTT